MINCDSCGKEMTDQNGVSMIALSINVSLNNESKSEEVLDFAQRQAGPYELDRTYNVCYECLLKSLCIKA